MLKSLIGPKMAKPFITGGDQNFRAIVHEYDLESGKITDVIDGFNWEGNRVPARYFVVAPHGDTFAFWSSGLWLVELPK